MKTKLPTLQSIVDSINAFFDTDPEYRTSLNVCEITIPNPDFVPDLPGYDELINVYASERVIRVKLRDPALMIEHDISFQPWRDGFTYHIWYDGSARNIDRSTNQAFNSYYIRSEEELFQHSTVHDFKGVELETFLALDKLHKRLYAYFDIEPCEIEA